ncbi:hypothetical protein CV_1721 [Chromobacterium violaceum ATCC 12472]|uniref:Uncharacterized protein n=1 Tax=Chromobacterium violaceum (strain ATCC 12472 / DSM 30191 / JCM 1249 / CCUG 213 / NBRC 12614 / NCIMB 9131 / NCTC 9757 / MK) TaxID=243365 RepID=Q7NXA6_CHRVO|nr:hypothetical protein CV_1721 [Chromobacterium violaceum ATCC 12472]
MDPCLASWLNLFHVDDMVYRTPAGAGCRWRRMGGPSFWGICCPDGGCADAGAVAGSSSATGPSAW